MTAAELRRIVESKLSLLETAVSVVLTTRPDVTVRATPSGHSRASHYRIAAHGLTRCEGGFVVVTWHVPGQRDSASVHLFDEWARQVRALEAEHELVSAADRVAAYRHQLLRGMDARGHAPADVPVAAR